MPLTDAGAKVKAKMTQKYGPERAEHVFYGSINKGNPGTEKWHGKRKAAKGRSMTKGRR